jgi:hypothetical protein
LEKDLPRCSCHFGTRQLRPGETQCQMKFTSAGRQRITFRWSSSWSC